MGDPRGFLKIKREPIKYRPVCERVKDYKHVFVFEEPQHQIHQASRCMDCGTPFCHWGCPVGNYIPEWNDLMFRQQWQRAYQLLEAKNPMPEVTGRVCPTLCEYACVLGINDDAVTVQKNELAIVEHAFQKRYIKPRIPAKRTGKKVAIVGSGPAGLSCASELNRRGHNVVVFERDDKIGGILRYGIPDFKLEKWVLDRRIDIWKKEGILFNTKTEVGEARYPAPRLLKEFDAVCLATGSRVPRDLKIKGRDLKGIYFAMDYLVQSNRRVAGESLPTDKLIDAKGKKVVVIGGGDTGADCVGVAHRQGASCVVQIELLPKPPEYRTEDYPWPRYPLILKTTTSHQEGGIRKWSILTKEFLGEDGRVRKLLCKRVEFSSEEKGQPPKMVEVEGSEFEIEADLVILAIGFLHTEHNRLLLDLNIEFDERGNVKTDQDYITSHKGIFSAGDMHRGQSLVVWAIYEGLESARCIDLYLQDL